MSDLTWIIIAGIVCICIAYGLGGQLGYRRGYRDAVLEQCIKEAEAKAKMKMELNKKYGTMTLKEVHDYGKK